MQRRQFVGSLLAAGAAVAASGARSADTPPAPAWIPGDYSSFDQWLTAARAGALQYLAAPHGREAQRFMRYLLLWAAAMPKPALASPPWQPVTGAREPLEFAMLAPGRPFVVSAFRMAPGCLLPAHCHPSGGGVTICMEGALDIQHFDLAEGAAPYSETGSRVAVRLESVTHLSTDRYTVFTPERSNLHQLRAGPAGAVGIDIAVQWKGNGEFSYLKFQRDTLPNPVEVGRIWKGTWSGMNIAEAYV
jgi:hypothetical protein